MASCPCPGWGGGERGGELESDCRVGEEGLAGQGYWWPSMSQQGPRDARDKVGKMETDTAVKRVGSQFPTP